MRRRPTTLGVNTNNSTYYALTISPTKNPSKVPYWEVFDKLQTFLQDSGCIYIEHAYELKTYTDVVHIHVTITSLKKLYFNKWKNKYPGWQFFFKELETSAYQMNWHYYLNKEGNIPDDLKFQQLFAQAARHQNLFIN